MLANHELWSDFKDNDQDLEPYAVRVFLHGLEICQEMAVPLLCGAFVAMLISNIDPDTYEYYFTSTSVPCETSNSTTGNRRLLGGAGCHAERWLLVDSDSLKLFGHEITLHFFANDIVMCFHFGLAMKEVTEAMLPGGSLNPPSKAFNPIITTMGGIIGPIAVYFILLEVFIAAGFFDAELASGLTWTDLSKGWGIVTATDIVLAWLVSRVVFGDGHPAIDYLLLLAVVDDAIGMAIIAVFYPDPYKPVKAQYLLIAVAGMLVAFLLRKWHYRKKYPEHQNWQPYIFLAGGLSWIGLIKAHLHPALAIIPIVPFMPGPDRSALEHLDEQVEAEIDSELQSKVGNDAQIMKHRERRISVSHGVSIQAGLYGGLVGHDVEVMPTRVLILS